MQFHNFQRHVLQYWCFQSLCLGVNIDMRGSSQGLQLHVNQNVKVLLLPHLLPPASSACSVNPTPMLERTCDPHVPCWRFRCSFSLNLFVMTKTVCAWFDFNPCSYDLNLGLGDWSLSANVMKLKLGVMHEFRVGQALRL